MVVLITEDAPELSSFMKNKKMLHWHLSDEFCHTAARIDDKDSSKKVIFRAQPSTAHSEKMIWDML